MKRHPSPVVSSLIHFLVVMAVIFWMPAQAAPKNKKKEKKMESKRKGAWTPEEELAGFTVPEGFVIELVASEKHGVINPIDLAFDDAGRLWTQTAQMYPLDPLTEGSGKEILRLMNSKKEQDANPEFQRIRDLYQLKTKGTDKILVHNDPTKAASGPLHVWADGLSIPQSILPFKDGAYVCHGSELFLLRDTDGDDRSDTVEPVLTGFGITDTHTLAHLLVRGPGRYIHFSQGALNQGKVKAVASGYEGAINAACQVRFGLDHQDFEVVSSGPSNMWGLQLRANGQWYGIEANDRGFSVIPWEHGTSVQGTAARPLRAYQPLLPVLHNFRVGGTGLSGLAFSEDLEGGFPYEEWKDVALLANPITSTINAVSIHRRADGTVEAEHLSDFLSSKDDWFRPVNLEFGPDGALYVADFYNKIVSHNEVSRAHPDRDKAHGRIWRIRYVGNAVREIPDVSKASPEELLAHLQSPSLWEKRAAWYQIVDRGLQELAPQVGEIAADASQPIATRINALWTLEGLKYFDEGLIDQLLAVEDSDLRREAVRSLSSFDIPAKAAAEKIAPFLEDAHCMVRSQVIRTLGDLRSADPVVLHALIEACKPDLGVNKLGGNYERKFERFLARMALERFPAELNAYLIAHQSRHSSGNLLWAIQALNKGARNQAFLKIWNEVRSQALDSETFIAIAGMLNDQAVFDAVKPTLQDPAKAPELIDLAIEHQARIQSDSLVRMLEPQVERLLSSPDTVAMGLQAVSQFKMDSFGEKVAAIEVPSEDFDLLKRLLAAQAMNPEFNRANFIQAAENAALPFDVRAEAISALARVEGGKAKELATAILAAGDANEKAQLASLLSQSKPGVTLLCALVEGQVLSADAFDLSAAERVYRARHKSPVAKGIIEAVQKRVAEQRRQAKARIDHLMAYIAKNPGDPEKGRATFTSCLTCHRVGDEGQDIAPPLDGSGHRDLEHLLTAIVDPDAAVEGGYGLYRVTQSDGTAVEGYLDKKDALGTTVAMMGGGRLFVPMDKIKSQDFVGSRSFMPPAFGQLPDEVMADLVAYIMTLKEAEPAVEPE